MSHFGMCSSNRTYRMWGNITSLIRYDASDKGKVIEYADKIDTSSQHLLGIINDVLDI